jgi:hypothetical protein
LRQRGLPDLLGCAGMLRRADEPAMRLSDHREHPTDDHVPSLLCAEKGGG